MGRAPLLNVRLGKKARSLLFLSLSILCFLFVLLTGFSYFYVEVLTQTYAHRFAQAHFQMTDQVEYIKIFEYTDHEVKIFVVDDSKNPVSNNWFRSGSFHTFHWSNPKTAWVEDKFDCVWSDDGSADGMTWPPYF